MDANERYRLHEEWRRENSDSYSARVRKEYLDQGHKLTDLTVKQLIHGSLRTVLLEDHEDYEMGEIESLNTNARDEFESRLPYLLDVIFENPFFREVFIPLKHLTEEFVTKSVMIPERVLVKIDLEIRDEDTPVDVDLELLTKFRGLQNLEISLYYDERMGEILSELPNLKHLSLSGKKITEFPMSLLNTDLKTLSMSCYIKEIPREIRNMMDLEHLSIRTPYLNDLPEEIIRLSNLRLLRIDMTEITDIRLLGQMENLIVKADGRRIIHKPKNFDLEKMAKDYFISDYHYYNYYLNDMSI